MDDLLRIAGTDCITKDKQHSIVLAKKNIKHLLFAFKCETCNERFVLIAETTFRRLLAKLNMNLVTEDDDG